MSHRRGSQAWRWLLLGVFLLPLGWAVAGSVDVSPDARGGWVVDPTLEHYREIFGGASGMASAMTQGLLVGVVAALLAVGVGFLAAVALRQMRSPWARRTPAALLLVSLMPPLAYGPALADGARLVGLYDSVVGLVLAEAGLTAPVAIWILTAYLAELPYDVDEAAALDGSTLAMTLWCLLLPAAWRGLVAALVVVFILCWNLFAVPSLLAFGSIQTVPIVLSSFWTYEKEMDWSTAAAALVVGMLPAVLVVAVAQRVLRSFAPLSLADERQAADVVRRSH